ncbi:MAG: hypothetical protein AB1416_10505 [Actinomycetota bacterium]
MAAFDPTMIRAGQLGWTESVVPQRSATACGDEAGEGTVYEHSRDLYRRLRGLLVPDARRPAGPPRALYAGCLEMVTEMAKEGGRAHRPAERLFSRVRHLFAPHAQLIAYRVIDREVARVAQALVERARRGGRGNLLTCVATTRRGKPCQREPLRGSAYCPSHRHLEAGAGSDDTAALTAAGAMTTSAGHLAA